MVKHCGRCKQDLPLSEFHACTRNKDGKQEWCKSCRKKHKSDERKQYHRDRYHNDTDGYRNYYYTRTYKISLEDYNELMMKQGGYALFAAMSAKQVVNSQWIIVTLQGV